jgi:hypothetical protein
MDAHSSEKSNHDREPVFEPELKPPGDDYPCNCTLNSATVSSKHHFLCDKSPKGIGFYDAFSSRSAHSFHRKPPFHIFGALRALLFTFQIRQIIQLLISSLCLNIVRFGLQTLRDLMAENLVENLIVHARLLMGESCQVLSLRVPCTASAKRGLRKTLESKSEKVLGNDRELFLRYFNFGPLWA